MRAFPPDLRSDLRAATAFAPVFNITSAAGTRVRLDITGDEGQVFLVSD